MAKAAPHEIYVLNDLMCLRKGLWAWGTEPAHEALSLSDLHISEFVKAACEAVPKMPITL